MIKRTIILTTLLATAAALIAIPGASGARTGIRHHSSAASAPLRFSHGVPIDEQRPGFEPDVVYDPNGNAPHAIYSSVPFGFSTTESFLWTSRDGGKSYVLTPGNVGPGKPTTCVGGGDTELATDGKGALFFSDLQGLTNLSNSVSTDGGKTWMTNCTGSPNTPVDRMWYAHSGSLAGGDLNLYEEYDAVASSAPSTNNQLVESVSHDGLTFGPLTNENPGPGCAGGGFANCVTDNEGLPGNQVVDPKDGNIYIAHSAPGPSDSGSPQVMVDRGKVTIGPPDTASWTDIGPLNKGLCKDPTCVDGNGNPEVSGAENFPVIAVDAAGTTLYVAFSSSPISGNKVSGPEEVYVVSSSDGTHWSDPVKVTGKGTNTFPWIVAGSRGRVDLAWYHSSETDEKGSYGAGALHNANWSLQFAQSLNAASASPRYHVKTVSEHLVKHGEICTNGLACVAGGDRSMGDFLEIGADEKGAALISYVDDTSQIYSGGEAAGPAEMIRQISGPSIEASTPTVSNAPIGRPKNRVSDRKGDAVYSANGVYSDAGTNVDLQRAALRPNLRKKVLNARIKVRDLNSLAPGVTAGGPNLSWYIRWVVVNRHQPGNGHIFYAGMESDAGGSPRFFDGDVDCVYTTTHCKYMTWPGDNTIKGSYIGEKGVIKLKIPFKDVGNPKRGRHLYNVLAFTTSEAQPLSADPIFNLLDATQPFTVVVRAHHRH